MIDSQVDQSVPYVEVCAAAPCPTHSGHFCHCGTPQFDHPMQVVGEVLSGNTMRANRHHTLGQEFDLDVYGQFCKISTGSMRHLFVRD